MIALFGCHNFNDPMFQLNSNANPYEQTKPRWLPCSFVTSHPGLWVAMSEDIESWKAPSTSTKLTRHSMESFNA